MFTCRFGTSPLCIQTVLVFKGRKGLRLPNPAAGATLALLFVQQTVCLRHSAEPAFCTQPDKSTSSGVSMKPKETAESLFCTTRRAPTAELSLSTAAYQTRLQLSKHATQRDAPQLRNCASTMIKCHTNNRE